MALSEPTETAAPAPSLAARRIVVYVVAAIALLVVLWSLIKGGERDLWNLPSAVLRPAVGLLQ